MWHIVVYCLARNFIINISSVSFLAKEVISHAWYVQLKVCGKEIFHD
jgi:hypothetical protein